MDTFLLYVVLGLPVIAIALTATGAWRRYGAVVGGAVPWLATAGLLIVAMTPGEIEMSGVMLGSGLLLDTPSRWLVAICALLFTILGLSHRRRLVESAGASASFLLAWLGTLACCLTGELLLFLAGTAAAGYALLAFALNSWQPNSGSRVAALAAMLLAGDLAMLELATLLVEVRTGSFFGVAAETLAGMRGQGLVELCLALGIAAPLAIPAAILVWKRDEDPGLVATLPGWLAIAFCSMLAGWRLTTGAGDEASISPWLSEVTWTLPTLLLLLVLPRLLSSGDYAIDRLGRVTADLRDAAVGALPKPEVSRLRSSLRGAESRMTSWLLAMSILVMLAAILLAGLLT